jgi:CO dehydrogenase maturation factor
MQMKLSVCGKGGSGKSVVVSLLARQARSRGLDVLAIDSDESNSGLFRMLGFEQPPVPLMELVGGKSTVKQKIGRCDILSADRISIEDIPAPFVVRQNGLRLMSIGKILLSLEGCACPMGVLCREFLKKLESGENELVIVDMEAGVEHFGRGIDEGIDAVLVVVEPSMESIVMAEKIRDLAVGVKKNLRCVLNKISSEEVSGELEEMLQAKSIEVAGIIFDDPTIFEACFKGQPIARGKALEAADNILARLLHRAIS